MASREPWPSIDMLQDPPNRLTGALIGRIAKSNTLEFPVAKPPTLRFRKNRKLLALIANSQGW